MEIRNWEERNSDMALHETNQELESQRMELHQTNQRADQIQREKINLWRELEIEKYHLLQNDYSFDALQAYCFRITIKL